MLAVVVNSNSIHRGLFDKVLRLGTIQLMDPTIINAADNRGYIPLHILCQIGDSDIVKYLIQSNVDSLEMHDLEGNCALHHVCLAVNCELSIASWISPAVEHLREI